MESVLSEVVEKMRKKFEDKLIAIILFGSYAKGKATRYSDLDLLLVVKDLPEKKIERFDIIVDIILYFLKKYGIRISPILVKPEELSPKFINPLIYGILTGYRVIYEKNEFWKNYLKAIKPIILKKKPIYIERDKEWEIAKLI